MLTTRLKKHLVLFLGVVLVSAGCGKSVKDEVSKKMEADINALGDVTLEDEDKINKLLQTYSTLTDDQKNNVDNYAKLLKAQDKIDESKAGQVAEKKAENEALLGDEDVQAVIAVVKQLKTSLKHPDSLKLYSVSYLKGHVDGIDNDVVLVLVDYEAQNDVGGLIRHSDSIGVGGFADGSCSFFNRDDGGAGDKVHNLYLIYHNAWLKCVKNSAATDVDVEFIMNSL